MKALVVLLVLAVIGGGAFLLLSGGPDLGIGPGHPLGTFEKLDAFAGERELDAGGAATPAEIVNLFRELDPEIEDREGLSGVKYLDRVPGFPHLVVVLRDGSGRVVGVAGQFRSGLHEFSDKGSRSNVMIARVWLAVAGAEPTFAKEAYGAAAGQDRLVAVASGGGWRASWRKEGPDGLGLPHQTVDYVALLAD